MTRQPLLHTDGLQLIRQDPRIPAEHLPADWLAIRAEKLFHTLIHRYEPSAGQLAATVLDEPPLRQ
ncbi:PaaX family transcriptional regulator C-terminal domain-containing protein [Nonomuraea sp. 3N208]|uniref:PaaX family transcriptional regulator C-terminal domain-containing protein n=1 Tax=Nonomuraea sp. 3N208 TaxID=3457421 RepID=UPI003FD156FA